MRPVCVAFGDLFRSLDLTRKPSERPRASDSVRNRFLRRASKTGMKNRQKKRNCGSLFFFYTFVCYGSHRAAICRTNKSPRRKSRDSSLGNNRTSGRPECWLVVLESSSSDIKEKATMASFSFYTDGRRERKGRRTKMNRVVIFIF